MQSCDITAICICNLFESLEMPSWRIFGQNPFQCMHFLCEKQCGMELFDANWFLQPFEESEQEVLSSEGILGFDVSH